VRGPEEASDESLPPFEIRLKAIRHAIEHSQGMTRKVEFPAVTMLQSDDDEGASGPTILVASPIYIASATPDGI
jgi:hypothetical protein